MARLTAFGMCARAIWYVIFLKIHALISRVHVPIAVNLCHADATGAFFATLFIFLFVDLFSFSKMNFELYPLIN